MNKETEHITITVDKEHFKQIESLAVLRRVPVEKLVEETMASHMASVNIALGDFSRNIFK